MKRKAPEHIKDLKPDLANAREHTPRNIGVIVDALQEVGAARSIVIDENDMVLAGNGVLEAAAEAGMTKVRVVEADGNEIIAVRRSNLTEAQKKRLALFDNRAGELARWNIEALLRLERPVMNGMWTEDELAALEGATHNTKGDKEPDITEGNSIACPACGFTFQL